MNQFFSSHTGGLPPEPALFGGESAPKLSWATFAVNSFLKIS